MRQPYAIADTAGVTLYVPGDGCFKHIAREPHNGTFEGVLVTLEAVLSRAADARQIAPGQIDAIRRATAIYPDIIRPRNRGESRAALRRAKSFDQSRADRAAAARQELEEDAERHGFRNLP